mgnify:CR=1 FL=1
MNAVTEMTKAHVVNGINVNDLMQIVEGVSADPRNAATGSSAMCRTRSSSTPTAT